MAEPESLGCVVNVESAPQPMELFEMSAVTLAYPSRYSQDD